MFSGVIFICDVGMSSMWAGAASAQARELVTPWPGRALAAGGAAATQMPALRRRHSDWRMGFMPVPGSSREEAEVFFPMQNRVGATRTSCTQEESSAAGGASCASTTRINAAASPPGPAYRTACSSTDSSAARPAAQGHVRRICPKGWRALLM